MQRETDPPIVVVVPGDLHLTEAGRDNARVARWVTDEINNLIRPAFVQFIGDNVQDATEDQFQLFNQIRGWLDVPHFVLVGDHDVKDDPARRAFAVTSAIRMARSPWGAFVSSG
jgi:hypothetical protein